MVYDPSTVPAPVERPVNQTSIAKPGPRHPDEVTLRFTRWTMFRQQAFQRNQVAGFDGAHVEDLIASGHAVVVDR